jgi:hypothetical protein
MPHPWGTLSKITTDKTNKTEGEFSRRVIQVEVGYCLDPPTFRFPSMMDKGDKIPDTPLLSPRMASADVHSLLGKDGRLFASS